MRAISTGVAASAAILIVLTACSGAPKKSPPAQTTRLESPAPRAATSNRRQSPYAPAQEDIGKRGNYTRGGLYAPEIQDSAPDALPDVDLIPEPEVRYEPRSLYGNRSPYAVLGKTYSVLADPSSYSEVGLASYYGNKFHGRRTSDLEVYDMYAFSAAHKTLPLPSFARVTNLANGRSVIVRVNDRGPFHDGRIIDLSYAAAVKLGVDRAGTARVEVRGLRVGEQASQLSDTVAVRAAASRTPSPLPSLLPAGVHIATGKPQPASAIDHLLAALPIADAKTTERALQVAPSPAAQRFDMRRDGRTMTADEFDQWMRDRRMRVATGKPGTPDAYPPAQVATVSAPSPPSAAPLASEIAPLPSSTGLAPTPAFASNAVTFQVASFAARANAERAQAMLTGAGIDSARLLDADANGHKVWRLRVGPVDPGMAPSLVARIQGLGFGQPQRVHE